MTSQSLFPLWPIWIKKRIFRNFHCQNNANYCNPVAYGLKSHGYNCIYQRGDFWRKKMLQFRYPCGLWPKSLFQGCPGTQGHKSQENQQKWAFLENTSDICPRSAQGAPEEHPNTATHSYIFKKKLTIVRSSGCYWYCYAIWNANMAGTHPR